MNDILGIMMAIFLSIKEVWRNKGRFFLFSLVIALITILVLFVAALAEGLAQANRQYLEKLNAELLVFQQNTEFSTFTSQLDRSKLNSVNRVEGVQAVGPIGFSTATLVFPNEKDNLNVSIIGVEPEKPGAPPVIEGGNLTSDRGTDIVMDQNVANRAHVQIGDTIRLKTIQDAKEEFYELRLIGLTDGRQYQFAPALFLPYRTWDQVRPQGGRPSSLMNETSNVIAVKLKNPAEQEVVAERIKQQVQKVDVADIKTAIKSIPGYSVQQSTLRTQQAFVLLIGILIIGGFFQIQVLQKVPQIGVLKAIGVENNVIGTAVVVQIIFVTTFGVLLGGLATLSMAIGIPPVVPIQFSGNTVAIAVASLLVIGPLGGLVSVRLAVRVEPLIALGLSQ
jgi:putative ABC transport system permease protein